MNESVLTEADKRRIEEEEKYRAKVKDELNQVSKQKPKGNGKGCLTVIMVFIALFIIGNIFSSPNKEKKTNKFSPTPTPEKIISEEYKASLAESFCKNRQGEYAYGHWICGSCIDLNEILNKSALIHNAKSPATSENCRKIVDICLEKWSEENCQDIAGRKIWLGMSRDQLILSWGVPKDENDTVGSWGVNTQWVYGDFGPYVYLEGKNDNDLVVTSWQD